MRYEAFIKKTENLGVIGGGFIYGPREKKGVTDVQFNRWVRLGKLIRLKRGLYALPEERRKKTFSLEWLAGRLYSPSYLSLEYALSWYDMIPERSVELTSVSVLKTAAFVNPLGRFSYRHLKKELFFGFKIVQDEFNRDTLMAGPEKALLDTLYFRKDWEASPAYFEKNLRLQQCDQLRKKRLLTMAGRFGTKKMMEAAAILGRMI